MFFRPWPAAALLAVEADAVVADAHDPAAQPLADPDLGVVGARVLADIREPFLDDAEHLDLLVGCEQDRRIDLDVHVERAVRGEKLDVAAERRVEGSRPAGRGQGEDREARLLLRGRRRLLQLRQRLVERCARLEHAGVRRDGKEVLREAVVDLARDAGSLLGDGTAELGEADRAPDADEQDAVAEQAEKVALGDEVARDARGEHVVQLGKEGQRRSEREPAVEVLAAPPVADGEADHRHEREEGEERGRDRELERAVSVPGRVEQAEAGPEARGGAARSRRGQRAASRSRPEVRASWR